MDQIRIRARARHNLKNLKRRFGAQPADRDHRALGLGKIFPPPSTTLYAEGQRRYVESLSTYARNSFS